MRSNKQLQFWSGELAAYPIGGFYVYLTWAIFSILSNHGMVIAHRDMIANDVSKEERWAIVLYVRALQSYVGTATESKKGKDS